MHLEENLWYPYSHGYISVKRGFNLVLNPHNNLQPFRSGIVQLFKVELSLYAVFIDQRHTSKGLFLEEIYALRENHKNDFCTFLLFSFRHSGFDDYVGSEQRSLRSWVLAGALRQTAHRFHRHQPGHLHRRHHFWQPPGACLIRCWQADQAAHKLFHC